MIKESVALVRPGAATGALPRLLRALAAWRKRVVERRRHIDDLSDHMLKDIGVSRWKETDWPRRG